MKAKKLPASKVVTNPVADVAASIKERHAQLMQLAVQLRATITEQSRVFEALIQEQECTIFKEREQFDEVSALMEQLDFLKDLVRDLFHSSNNLPPRAEKLHVATTRLLCVMQSQVLQEELQTLLP